MLAIDLINIILWFIILYSVIHFFLIQVIAYKDRTVYQKVITWLWITFIILIFIWAISR